MWFYQFIFLLFKRNPEADQIPNLEDLPEDNPTLCERCGCGDREDSLLLCDGCDLGYHMDCLVPSLSRVPRGRWFCPTCEASGLISDYLQQRPRRLRIEDPLPRTLENVRIRAAIQRTILQVSSLVGSGISFRDESPQPSTSRKVTRKRRKKRKTTAKSKTSMSKDGTKTTKKKTTKRKTTK